MSAWVVRSRFPVISATVDGQTDGHAEDALLAVAARVAALPGVPEGVFAVITDEDSPEIGAGRRVEPPTP